MEDYKLHYVKGPKDLIFIDFDIPDEKGEKCFAKNLEAAAELSKSRQGIHLYYLYSGDASKLSRVFGDHTSEQDYKEFMEES